MSQESPQVFNGRYELLRHIARGGMAEVYLARDLMLDRNVALKVLFPELSTDRSFVERFRREAQAAANLNHPNIVSIFDWGEEAGTYFIVMEYLEGRTLSQLIRGEGPLLPDRAADIGADIAAALSFAHESGMIHRDVKPGNVLISSNGHVKVTDFGIARAVNSDSDLTQTGTVMGTATYFSPEQAQGHRLDQRSDVYSLGVVLYEMVVGRPPFEGDNAMAVAYKHVREPPVPPRQINPDVPQQFQNIILQAMAKNTADRYVNASELRNDLLRYGQGRPVYAEPTMAAAPVEQSTVAAPVYTDQTAAMSRTQAAGVAAEPTGPPPRRTGAFVLLLVVMLLILGGLLYVFARETGLVGTTDSPRVQVPNVIGRTADEAAQVVEDAGLVAERQVQQNEAEPDTVFDQEPKGDATVDRGSSVILFISGGQEQVEVPNVVGKDIDTATNELEALGLVVRVSDRPDEAAPRGQVLEQDPEPGEEIARGSTVELTQSAGKPTVSVPDVRGQNATDAEVKLRVDGFTVERRREPSADVDADHVIRTDPSAGTQVEKGSTVTLVVSSGPEQTSVPDVIGDSESEARAKLEAAGFSVSVQERTVANAQNDGRVIDQDPRGGTQATSGSTVTIVVGRAVASTTTTTTATTTTTTGDGS
jgi:serine/threonine-protein kinase